MTTEEKAKAYDRAVNEIRNLRDKLLEEGVINKDGVICDNFNRIFPELKESKDERIRKELIDFLEYYRLNNVLDSKTIFLLTDSVAWLEKQGEHANFRNKIQIGDKVTRNKDGILVNISQLNRVAKKREKQGEQKPTDKVEPKFKIGDYVVGKYISGYISEVRDDCYLLDYQGFPIDKQDDYHLWTIQDAKDGDVLYSPCCKLLWIYKDGNSCYIGNNLNYNENCVVVNSPICIPTDVVPATKEQRELLFQKMKEAGYMWDAEKKELKMIEQTPNDEIGNYDHGKVLDALMSAKKTPESAWSEEDEEALDMCINAIPKAWKTKSGILLTKWLKKHFYQQSNQKWDKKDSEIMDELIYELNQRPFLGSPYIVKFTDWLKSLKDRFFELGLKAQKGE